MHTVNTLMMDCGMLLILFCHNIHMKVAERNNNNIAVAISVAVYNIYKALEM